MNLENLEKQLYHILVLPIVVESGTPKKKMLVNIFRIIGIPPSAGFILIYHSILELGLFGESQSFVGSGL